MTKLGLLAPALQRVGVEVEILTANFGQAGSSVAPGRRVVDGVPVTYLRRFVSRGFVSLAPGAGGVVRTGFDLVHGFGLRDGLVTSALVAARRARTPIVLEPMGMAVPRIRSTRLKTLFDRCLREVTRGAAATVATSPVEEAELRALGYPNVTLRPNPIAPLPSDATRGEPAYDLCYVGRLHDKKRLADIVTALVTHPEWTAVVAGPDEDGSGARLARAARAAGVEHRLELRGWVEQAEKAAIIRASKVFVLPSASENFGNAAAEAIALGTPVVVTDACGVAELVAATGAGAVVPVDTGAVLRAIERVLRAESPMVDRDALAAYAPARVAEQQRAIYEAVLR